MKKISVVIRIRNEEQWVGHCIQSVLDFIEKPEIIIVDNNSIDNSLKNISLFKEDPNLKGKNRNYNKIKILNINDYSPGKALNLGIKNSSGEYILVISAHCILKNFDQNQLIKLLKKNIAVFGKQNPKYYGKSVNPRYIWSHFAEKPAQNMYSNLEKRYFFHNALSFFKRKTLIDFPFDEKLTSKEDRYWINNIRKKKLNFYYHPEFQADHNYTINGNSWKSF